MPTFPVLVFLYSGFGVLHVVWIFGNRVPWNIRFKALIHPNAIRIYVAEVTVVFIQTVWAILIQPSNTMTDLILSIIGLILFSAGILTSIWAKIIMSDSWGPPGQLNISIQKNLVTSGPFTYSRNPIYIGLFLTLLGFSTAIRSPLIFLHIIFIIFVGRSVSSEEKLLEHKYGNSFRQYCKRVPRWI